jgi:hypothetical protein
MIDQAGGCLLEGQPPIHSSSSGLLRQCHGIIYRITIMNGIVSMLAIGVFYKHDTA